jgi:hypothetical protein
MYEGANIKLVQLVAEYPIFYDWRSSGYSRKEKIHPVWEHFDKG